MLDFEYEERRMDGIVKSLSITTACLCALLIAAMCGASAQQADAFTAPGGNIALGKAYTLDPAPNYGLCTEQGDAVQLTDGKYAPGDAGSALWVLPACVGWQRRSPANITIDLGEVAPIAGVSYSTAAGGSGVAFPSAILILASEDGETFHLIGELRHLSAKYGTPAPGRYRFRTDALKARARYLRLSVIASGMYTFCDEVEVYRGAERLLDQPVTGPVIKDPGAFQTANRTRLAIRTWITADISRARRLVEQANVADAFKAPFLKQLDEAERASADLPDDPGPDFRAVFPLTAYHARALAVVGGLRAAQGRPPVRVWRRNRWERMDLWDAVSEASAKGRASLDVRMLRNEIRGETFCITNNTAEPMTAHLVFEGLPGGGTPDYLQVQPAEYVAMQSGRWEANALPVAAKDDGGWVVPVPAGMARQVWLSFRAGRELEAGTYDGRIVLRTGVGPDLGLLLRLSVAPVVYPDEHTLSVSMWDYTDAGGHRVLRESNVQAAVDHMRSYGYNAPWGETACFPWAKPGHFDEDDKLVQSPNFSVFDAWVTMWPDARYYMVYAHVGEAYAGAAMGTPQFERRLAAAMRGWVDHARDTGVDPAKIGVCLVDEPSGGVGDKRILAWASVIKAAAPEIVIFEDPRHTDPRNAKTPEMFEICDILCPSMGHYSQRSDDFRAFYQEMRSPPRQLWFYSCGGGPMTNDAIGYYRAQQWRAWRAGATGTAFWAYGDAGGAHSSWNSFAAQSEIYTPVYIDNDSATDGKHWLGIIEGVQDYEYLRMLRDRIELLEMGGQTHAKLTAARKVLLTVPDDVITAVEKGDRAACDRGRLAVLEALVSLGM